MPLLLALYACSGDDPADSSADPDPDITDTAEDEEVTPVWSQYAVGTSATLQGIYASGGGVYVAGTGGLVWVGGASDPWTSMDPEVDDNDITDLWGTGLDDTLELYASATSGYVAHHVGGAWSTEDLGTSNHEGIGGSGPEALFVVSWGGIQAWDGSAWTFEAPPSDEKLNEVYALGSEAIAVGEAGAILRRSADGAWTAMESGVEADLASVAGTSLSDVWAVGADGTTLHFDGSTWTSVPSGVTASLWGVFAPASTAVFAVGNNGVAIAWDGAAWSELPTGVDNNLYAIHGSSATNMWAVGNRGMAIQYKVD